MLRGIINFIQENFVLPLFGNSIQLNPLNTVFYSALLAGTAVLLISRIRESDFSINRKFFISSTPILILTGFIIGFSTASDLALLESPYSFLIAGLTAGLIITASIELPKRNLVEFHRVLFSLPLPGILLFLLVSTPKMGEMLTLSSIVVIWSLAGYTALKLSPPEFMKIEFVYPLFTHYLDASTSFIAINGGAREKMFIGRVFVDSFGPGGIFVLKSLIIVPLVYYIFQEIDGEERLYLLYFIGALGLVLSAGNVLGGF
jgi:uncharacterized membrane protein